MGEAGNPRSSRYFSRTRRRADFRALVGGAALPILAFPAAAAADVVRKTFNESTRPYIGTNTGGGKVTVFQLEINDPATPMTRTRFSFFGWDVIQSLDSVSGIRLQNQPDQTVGGAPGGYLVRTIGACGGVQNYVVRKDYGDWIGPYNTVGSKTSDFKVMDNNAIFTVTTGDSSTSCGPWAGEDVTGYVAFALKYRPIASHTYYGWIKYERNIGGDMKSKIHSWAYSTVHDQPIQAGTSVTLVSLLRSDATSIGANAALSWETASEIETVGFHVHRSTSRDGKYVRVTDTLIPSAGDPVQGASYEWVDTTAAPGTTHYYKLEDIDMDGVSRFHGPVEVTLPLRICGSLPGADAPSAGFSIFSLFIPPAAAILAMQRRRRKKKSIQS